MWQYIEPHMNSLLNKVSMAAHVHRDGMSNLHTLQVVCKRAAETMMAVDRGLLQAEVSPEIIAKLQDTMLANSKSYLHENAETISNEDYARISTALDIGFAKVHARHIAEGLAIPMALPEHGRQKYHELTEKLTESSIAILGGLLRKDASVIERRFAAMQATQKEIRTILEPAGKENTGNILSQLFEEIKAKAESRILMDESQQAFFESALDDAIAGMARKTLPDLEGWNMNRGRA